MSGEIGSLSLKLMANIADYMEGLSKAEAQTAASVRQMQRTLDAMESNAKKLAGAIVTVGAAMVAGFTLDKMKAEFDRTVGMAAQMRDLALQVGGTVERMSQLTGVASMSGMASETLAQGLSKLAKGMSGVDDQGSNTTRALKAMGLSVTDANGAMKGADEMFVEIAQKMAGYTNNADKVRLATDLMGRAGAMYLPVMENMIEAGDLFIGVTTEQANRAEEYERAVRALRLEKEKLVTQIVHALVPAALSIVQGFTDVAKEGNGVTDAIKRITTEGVLTQWANDAAIFLAQVADVFKQIGDIVPVVASKLAVFWADIKIGSAVYNGDVVALKAALDERQAALNNSTEEFKRWAAKDLNEYENHVRRRQMLASITWDTKLATDVTTNAPYVPPKAKTAAVEQEEKAIKELDDAMKFLLQTEAKAIGLDKEYFEGLQKLRVLFAYQPELLDRINAAMQHLNNEYMKRVNAPILEAEAAYNKALDELNKTIAKGRTDLDAFVKSENDNIAALGRTERETMQLRLEMEGARIVNAAWSEVMDKFGGDVLPEVVVAYIKMQQEAKQFAIDASLRYVTDGVYKQIEAIKINTSMMLLDNDQREKAIALLEAERRGLVVGGKAYNDLSKAIQDSLDARKYATELKGLTDQLTDAVIDAFDGQEGAIKRVIAIFKAEFAKLVLRPIIEPIMQGVANFFLGLLGLSLSGGGGGGAAGGVGGVSNALSLANIGSKAGAGWEWLTGSGGYGMADRSLGETSFFSAGSYGNAGTVGGIFGTAAINYAGGNIIGNILSKDEDAGTTAGTSAAIGGYIASAMGAGPWGVVAAAFVSAVIAALGDSEGPAMRHATVTAGLHGQQYTYGMESTIGTLGIQRGTDTWFSDSEMGQTLTDWFKGLYAIDERIAERLSPEQLTAAQASVAGGQSVYEFGIEHQGIPAETFGAMVRQRYGAIFSSFDESMGALILGFEGTTEDLVNLIDDLSVVNYRLTHDAESIKRIFGQEIKFPDVAKFKKDTETYSETLDRLGKIYFSTNSIAEMWGKTQDEVWGGVGLATEEIRENLIELCGGLDSFNSSLSSYYNHYFSEEEKRTFQMQHLTDVFKGLGIEMPTSLEGFRALVQSLDLTTESGRNTFAVLMSVEGSFFDLFNTVEDGEQTLHDAGDAWEENGRKIKEWADRMKEAGQTMHQSIGESIHDIERYGLGPSGLENWYGQHVGEAAVAMSQARTPEELQAAADLERQLIMDWWNSLSEDEKTARKPEFLQWLANLDTTFATMLAALLPPKPTPKELADQNQGSANTMKDAADISKAAAVLMHDAAALAMMAAQTPHAVAISLSRQPAAEVGV